ncbi:MAG TPA: hypothetical protein VMY77_15515 [Chitinophagaceae bacterium]|nr:hypothetical protein [Chitinophagaceae bacterium]
MRLQNNLKFIVLLIIGSLVSCTSAKYRDVSEFNMQPEALKEGERIRLIAYFFGPSKTNNDSYNHVLVVSEESGDTCNILIPWDHGFTQTDGDSIYNYFRPESLINNIKIDDNTPGTREVDLKEITSKFPEYNKVIRIPEFDDVAINKFPTVKGSVGKIN